MHGDRVEVTLINRTARGAEGRIDRIVTRRNPRVAGVLRRRGKSTWLEPDDSRVRGPVVVDRRNPRRQGRRRRGREHHALSQRARRKSRGRADRRARRAG